MGAPLAQGRAGEDGDPLMIEERLGALRVGLAAAQVSALLGPPTRRGSELLSQARGGYEERWEYPPRGLWITLSGDKNQANKSIVKIEAAAPCKLATRRGVRIGSPIARVRTAYATRRFTTGRDGEVEQFFVGSRYGGIRFDIVAGTVTRIYIGPFAE
jgi:hypothetical protein